MRYAVGSLPKRSRSCHQEDGDGKQGNGSPAGPLFSRRPGCNAGEVQIPDRLSQTPDSLIHERLRALAVMAIGQLKKIQKAVADVGIRATNLFGQIQFISTRKQSGMAKYG